MVMQLLLAKKQKEKELEEKLIKEEAERERKEKEEEERRLIMRLPAIMPISLNPLKNLSRLPIQ